MDNIHKDNRGRGLRLAHLNVRSMLGGNKFEIIQNQFESSLIDIFSVSETWLTEATPDHLIELPSYNISRLDRNWGHHSINANPKRGGILACFIKKGIKFSDTKYATLNVSCKDLEMQFIALNLENVRPLIVINVYRPPQGNCEKCCNLIQDAFTIADYKDNTEFFIMGDFNINFADKKSPGYGDLLFTMSSLGLKQLVKLPTRTSFHNGQRKDSTLDLVFTNSEITKEAVTLDFNIIDHLAVQVTRKKVWVKPHIITFKGRSYKNYDKENFQ